MKVVVLISGNGSNLQALIDNSNDIGINIAAVISNQKKAFGLQRAKKVDITTKVVLSKDKTREEFESELIKVIDFFSPKIILLAGFMRILTNNFIKKYNRKILNIHPSLLPKFKGLNTHQRALDAKEKIHGATVHLVTNKLDSGNIIMQKNVKISCGETAISLAKKVLQQEHILYPQAIKRFING